MRDKNETCLFNSGKRDEIEKYLYKVVYPSIERLVLSNNGTTEDAKDIFHDSLIVLLTKIRENITIWCKMSSYLYAIANNLWKQKIVSKQFKYNVKLEQAIMCEDEVIYENNSSEAADKEKAQELYEILLLKCKLKMGNNFMDIVASKNQETRKKRWYYKKKLAQIIRSYPEFNLLKQYVDWLK